MGKIERTQRAKVLFARIASKEKKDKKVTQEYFDKRVSEIFKGEYNQHGIDIKKEKADFEAWVKEEKKPKPEPKPETKSKEVI